MPNNSKPTIQPTQRNMLGVWFFQKAPPTSRVLVRSYAATSVHLGSRLERTRLGRGRMALSMVSLLILVRELSVDVQGSNPD